MGITTTGPGPDQPSSPAITVAGVNAKTQFRATIAPMNRVSAALSIVAAVVAAVALVVAIGRPSAAAPDAAAEPAALSVSTESGLQELCADYALASVGVRVGADGPDPAEAMMTTLNAAGILEAAAQAPDLAPGDAEMALDLARAYRATIALRAAPEAQWAEARAGVAAADADMKAMCDV